MIRFKALGPSSMYIIIILIALVVKSIHDRVRTNLSLNPSTITDLSACDLVQLLNFSELVFLSAKMGLLVCISLSSSDNSSKAFGPMPGASKHVINGS